MAQHLLIATATSAYPNLSPKDARPQLSGVLVSVVRLFKETLKCYRRELEPLAENPTADELRKTLDKWFGAAERDPSDWVVFYYTGHAEVVAPNSLYLLTSDFMPSQYVGTAFSVQQLADMVTAPRDDGQTRRVRNLFVILDTCFAGRGTASLVSQLSNVLQQNSGNSFYLLGAALPRQEAQAGALAKALIASIEDLSKRYVQQEYLFPDQILPEINKRLRSHKAVLSNVLSGSDEPRFFPNPSFVNTTGMPVPASEAQRAITDQEFREHWGPRARGVEFDSQPGFYFSGRKAVLSKLLGFLNDEGDSRTRVITGRPGSGKSAILSRLVTFSLPELRPQNIPETERFDFVPIDLAIHARGKSLQNVIDSFARLLQVEARPDAVLDYLRRTDRPRRVVVDALDEAAEPAAIATQLLQPLNEIESVKLLVGTRADLLNALHGAEVIDIDRPEYAEHNDIAQYVKARLLRAEERGAPTPYAGKKALANRVAAAVAKKAYPNFFVARLIVEDLLLRPRPVNPDSPANMAFPTRVASAFNTYLARFGDREVMVRNIALPLAYAEGQGLPWDNIWAPLATAIARQRYDDDDVRWVLEHAGAFILESVEDGRSVYRLYHQALADTLREGRRVRSVDAAFTKVLRAAPPRRAGGAGADWFLASRYIRAHLATHAARCGRLGQLVNDPLYLLAADPNRLLSAISNHGDQVPRDIAAVYREAVHHIRGESPAEAASYLELVARQRDLKVFADRIEGLPLSRGWRATWAKWSAAITPSQFFGKGNSEILTLAVARWGQNRSVALAGRRNGAVEVWDIARGERLVEWRPEGVEAVSHLALSDTGPEPLLVVSWTSGHIGVLHVATRKNIVTADASSKEITSTDTPSHMLPESRVIAMCLTELHGEPVCVTAHADLSLVVRALPNLDPIIEKRPATKAKIYGLHVVQADGHRVLVSAGDSLWKDRDTTDLSMLKFWSLADLSVRWEDARNRPGALHYIEEGGFFGRNAIVISQNGWGPLQVWDVEKCRLLFEDEHEERSMHAWLYNYERQPLLIHVHVNELTVRRLEPRVADNDLSLTASKLGRQVQVQGNQFSSIFPLYGRATLLSTDHDHIRVWDVDDLLAEAVKAEQAGASQPWPLKVRSLATAASRPSELYMAKGDEVVALDASTGVIKWERKIERIPDKHEFESTVTDIATVPDRDWLVAAITGNSIHLLDLTKAGACVRVIPIPGQPARVRIARWCGQILAFITIENDRAWRVGVWDLDTGQAIPTHFAYQLHAGEEDKTMHGLAATATDGSLQFAFASKYGKVMIAEWGAQSSEQHPFGYDEWYIPHTEGEYVECLAMGTAANQSLLAAGTASGVLALWEMQTRKVKAQAAHVGKISTVCFGSIGGEPVLASGGDDRIVRFWSSSLKELCRIDVGEAITTITWIGPGRLAVGSVRGLIRLDFAPGKNPAR